MDKPEPFPTDVDELTALVQTLQAQILEQTQFIDQLLEQIRLTRHQHFGARSERFSLDQLPVPFNNNRAAAEPTDEPGDTDTCTGARQCAAESSTFALASIASTVAAS